MKLKDFDELCMLCSSPRWLERGFEIDLMPKDLAPLRRALLVDFGPELMQRWSPRWLERRFAIDLMPKDLATLACCFYLALVVLENFGAPLVPRWLERCFETDFMPKDFACWRVASGSHSSCLLVCLAVCLAVCVFVSLSICLQPGFVARREAQGLRRAVHAVLVSVMAGALF